MNLIDKLREDRITALKQKFPIVKDILSVAISEATKDNKNPTDDIVLKIIKKIIKGIDESIKYLDQLSDNCIKLSVEKDTLVKYLPKQLETKEILGIIKALCQHEDPTLKEVMAFFSKEYKNQVDMKVVQSYVVEFLKGVNK
ncbi:MAG: GatB/YqeY domain-containing protein [Tenuifilaceae bacterium]|nr:GatB/YqeY domain-containing protein [Tenuifilaceae bacterium]